MDLFVAPAHNEIKTVAPALANKLLKSCDAFAESDGRISCGNGYITCALPKLTKTDARIAERLGSAFETMRRYHARYADVKGTPDEMDHHKIANDNYEQRWMAIKEFVDGCFWDEPLKLAAIRVAADINWSKTYR